MMGCHDNNDDNDDDNDDDNIKKSKSNLGRAASPSLVSEDAHIHSQ